MPIFTGREGSIQLQREFPAPVILPGSALVGDTVIVNSDGWAPTDEVVLIHGSGVVEGFLYRSELDRVTLHSTPEGALNNLPATAISLSGVTAGPMMFASKGTAGQTSTLSSFLGSLTPAPTVETSLQAYPSTFNSYIAGGASATPWTIQAVVENYRLNTSGNIKDISALGSRFSESVKTLISGEGTIDFYIDLYVESGSRDIDQLLRLSLMLDQGAVAVGKFFLRGAKNMPDALNRTPPRYPYRGALYYETKLLISDSVLDVSGGDVITGSADFVTTGPIRLRTSVS